LIEVPATVQQTEEAIGIFKYIAQYDTVPPVRCNADEIVLYLQEPRSIGSSDPLQYWLKQHTKYPILSELARKYLSFPATSGSVERIFSVAGSLISSRRSKLTRTQTGNMLMYREYRIESILKTKK